MSGFTFQIQQFAEISTSLENMVLEKKVDLSIVENIDKLLNYTLANEQKYKESQKVEKKTAFTIYHTWRNLRLVLFKMKKRLIESILKHENPEAAVDSLRILPNVVSIFTNVNRFQDRELPYDQRSQMYEWVRMLRTSARRSGMLPSLDEELVEVNAEQLKTDLERLLLEVRLDDDEEYSDT